MAKGKAKSRREARKERKEQEQAAVEAARRAAGKRRIVLIAVPLVTVAIAAGLYLNEVTRFASGIVLLGGFLVWLALALSAIGKGVPARDRGRAGNIDYGRR